MTDALAILVYVVLIAAAAGGGWIFYKHIKNK